MGERKRGGKGKRMNIWMISGFIVSPELDIEAGRVVDGKG